MDGGERNMRLLGQGVKKQANTQRNPKTSSRNTITKISRRVVLVLAVGSFTLMSSYNGWFENSKMAIRSSVIKASIESGFVVDDISLIGRINTKKSEIMEATKVARGQSILEIDPKKIHSQIEALPWVEFAVVQRYWPNKLVITISERRPIAIWQKDSNLALIDLNGNLIKVSNFRPFRKLPTLVGEDAPSKASDLLKLLTTEPTLSKEVLGATWVGGRRWNVSLRGGIEVRLPEINPGQAWGLLSRVNQKYTLLERDINIIDLRLPNRIIVNVGPRGRQIIMKAGKNT